MLLQDQLPLSVNLSKTEKEQLDQIERAGRQSVLNRLLEMLVAAMFPGFFLGVYLYILHKGPHAGLTLCKLHGTFYIPETGALEELLQIPVGILCFTGLILIGGVYHLQSQRRLMHKILTATLQKRDTGS